ncbi:MAG: hypothetical protein ACKO15_01585 [Burkholderiales bacterium]
MSRDLAEIKALLDDLPPADQQRVFRHLRQKHQIHTLETVFGASAEVILEAIHRAPELTRRMLRGVIADAAFAEDVVPSLAATGWRAIPLEGNFSYDHKVEDARGAITIQVKLQRSEKGRPVVTSGTKYGLAKDYYMVECQRTRSGTTGEKTATRPYTFGEFDVLAVSLQPSTGAWNRFHYTVAEWLIPGDGRQIATYQPVAMSPNAERTDDFNTVANWLRSGNKTTISGKRA